MKASPSQNGADGPKAIPLANTWSPSICSGAVWGPQTPGVTGLSSTRRSPCTGTRGTRSRARATPLVGEHVRRLHEGVLAVGVERVRSVDRDPRVVGAGPEGDVVEVAHARGLDGEPRHCHAIGADHNVAGIDGDRDERAREGQLDVAAVDAVVGRVAVGDEQAAAVDGEVVGVVPAVGQAVDDGR